MSNTYDDQVKQKSREQLKGFIERNLLTFRRPKDVTVVCFPGAEVEGEEGLEIKEVYDRLGIPRSNIVGIEGDPEIAERLRNADLGIVVESGKDLDYFKRTDRQFDVISLDYTGYRDGSKWQALHQIAGRQLLYGNGILCTNYSARRETRESQAQMLALQADSIICAENEQQKLAELENLIKRFEDGEKLDLGELRDTLTYRTLSIMRMGTSALEGINLLTTHPNYKLAQERLLEIEENKKNNLFSRFNLSHRYDSGMEDRGASHPLSFLYRELHINLLTDFVARKNGITKNLANFFVHYLVDQEMKTQVPRAIERCSYISNKNATMEMDLIAFTSTERVYRKLRDNVLYNQENGDLTVTNINKKKLLEIGQKIRDQQEFVVPERTFLGSSWKPPERINKDGAIDLLRSGCSPKEIFEIYRGFSIGQLAAFKAHYVTMGKMEKVK